MRRYLLMAVASVLSALAWGASDGLLVKRVMAGSNPALKPLDAARAQPYGKGFSRAGDVFVCDNGGDPRAQRGVAWSLELNQREPMPVAASAWANSEGATGPGGGDFSLYLDIVYADGSCLWGQAEAFDPDAGAGWHRREVVVMPEKPIRHLSFYLLYRNRSGRACFRDASFGEMNAGGMTRFDGAVVKQEQPPMRGFLLRDVAKESGFVALEACALGVRFAAETRQTGDADFYDVTLADTTGVDRALTLIYTVPLPAGDLTWFQHPRRQLALAGNSAEALYASRHPLGANGMLSRYPFGAVAAAGEGWAIGIDPAAPAFYRVACQPATRELYLACDVGLAPEKPSAHVRFCVFRFPAAEAFRGALARFYALYPTAFETRVKRQGVWMPFAPISKVEGWTDFGFRFKEGDGETAWDDAHDMLTFRYTEPMTWWMSLKGEGPRTLERGAEEARRAAASGDHAAQAWISSAFEDERGRAPGRVLDTPWCNGVVWSMNSAPGVAGEVTDFSNKFGRASVEKRYGASSAAHVDGEYIDSAEAYVTEELDFRRSHFAGMDRPLCYALRSRRLGIYKGLIGFEYVRAIEREMHARGRLMMANSTPINWSWLAPLLDVMGTETDWNHGGKWSPMSDEELLYRRALCKGKPYCFLMNTDFSAFPYEASEAFMKRSLAYGMFPGFFSADASTGQYFTRPELYNRDRPLFKTYVPLCRLVAEAGWEPLTGAESDNPEVIVERFGARPGKRYLTVFNLGKTRQRARIARRSPELAGAAQELLAGGSVDWQGDVSEVALDPGDVRVFAFGGP